MEDAIIDLPRRDIQGEVIGSWKITGCWTKLCLKYGVIGPWLQPNWSVAFDRYALSRGPQNGPLSLADFAVTLLMNSRITSKDILALTEYLGRDDVHQQVNSLMSIFISRTELRDMCAKDVIQLGEFLDALIAQVHGVGNAKAYKALSAWAPSHVFMLDSAVREALTGCEKGPPYFPSAELIERFRSILKPQYGTLSYLGKKLAVAANLQAPLPPVRVLDSLIWFDWWACHHYSQDFGDWVQSDWNGDQHKIMKVVS